MGTFNSVEESVSNVDQLSTSKEAMYKIETVSKIPVPLVFSMAMVQTESSKANKKEDVVVEGSGTMPGRVILVNLLRTKEMTATRESTTDTVDAPEKWPRRLAPVVKVVVPLGLQKRNNGNQMTIVYWAKQESAPYTNGAQNDEQRRPSP